MSGDGTEKLRENLLDQQERLFNQLADIEEVKNDLDDTEYNETKADTLDQIMDVANRLQKLEAGNITLSDLNSAQLKATREAITNAFRTPEVLRMFARREPDQLKQRLKERERDYKLGKLTSAVFNSDKRELLMAIRQLGENLTVEETEFLSEDQTDRVKHFEKVSENPEDAAAILKWAKQQSATTK